MSQAQQTTDIVVIGGGLIGLSIAWDLARAGARVVVCEARRCGRAASWASAGIVHSGSATRSDPLARLRRMSAAMYPDWTAALTAATGVETGYERCGLLDLILDENQRAAAERELKAAAGQRLDDGRPSRLRLDREDLERRVRGIERRIRAALHIRDAAQVRSPRLLQALVAACRTLGVIIREHTPVCGLERRRARCCGVRTATDRIVAGHVVLAAGAWSSLLAEPGLEPVRVHPVRGQIVLLRCPLRPFGPVLQSGRHYLVPRADGRVLVGSTEEPEAGFDETATAEGVRRLIELAIGFVPALRSARLERAWAGLRPATPDGRPWLGPVDGREGLWVATGHFRSGIVLAPATGRLLAEWITRGRPEVDFDLDPLMVGRVGSARAHHAAPST